MLVNQTLVQYNNAIVTDTRMVMLGLSSQEKIHLKPV